MELYQIWPPFGSNERNGKHFFQFEIRMCEAFKLLLRESMTNLKNKDGALIMEPKMKFAPETFNARVRGSPRAPAASGSPCQFRCLGNENYSPVSLANQYREQAVTHDPSSKVTRHATWRRTAHVTSRQP